MRVLPMLLAVTATVGLFVAAHARAETPADFLRSYETAAKQADAGFGGFSVQRGETFFKTIHGREWSCATCHTQNPAVSGQHARTNKNIAPLSPVVNAERFTQIDKVEKWFKRNCNDVLGRACTAQEQGDVLTYLMSVKK
jgi:hypothetical protein